MGLCVCVSEVRLRVSVCVVVEWPRAAIVCPGILETQQEIRNLKGYAVCLANEHALQIDMELPT